MLLRVEYQAAQSRVNEADLVGDILLCVRRINGMIGEIHQIMSTTPPGGLAPPVAQAAMPTAAGARSATVAPGDEQGTEASGGSMALRALMASVIVFLFWLLGKRQSYIKAQRRKVAAATARPEAAPTQVPDGATLVAMPPPATPTASERDVQPRGVTHAPTQVAAPPQPDPASMPRDDTVPAAANAPIEFEFIAPAAAQVPIGEPAPRDFDAHADQALELAEIMVSMGLAQGAADALTERIRNNPRRALFHWLKLLEVYRQAQRKDDFERAAQELRQAFNVQPAGWAAGPGSISIEDFPHLVHKLLQSWPTPACTQFLNDLLEDNRGGTRNGLPQSVAEEILLLERILNAEAAANPA